MILLQEFTYFNVTVVFVVIFTHPVVCCFVFDIFNTNNFRISLNKYFTNLKIIIYSCVMKGCFAIAVLFQQPSNLKCIEIFNITVFNRYVNICGIFNKIFKKCSNSWSVLRLVWSHFIFNNTI